MTATLPTPAERAAFRARVKALPRLPSVACELLGGEMDALDLPDLARRIAADQALAARVLRLANSPFYGLARQVGSIEEAVMVLGFRAVRSLVVWAALASTVVGLHPGTGFDTRRFWRHSIAAAVAARQVARVAGLNAETAFTIGLLHDIGQLVLAALCPERYAPDAATAAGPLFSHAEAGAELATDWQLPPAICTAIACHHDPDAAGGEAMADLACIADFLAHGLLSEEDCSVVPGVPLASCRRLGMDPQGLPALQQGIAGDLEETLNAFCG